MRYLIERAVYLTKIIGYCIFGGSYWLSIAEDQVSIFLPVYEWSFSQKIIYFSSFFRIRWSKHGESIYGYIIYLGLQYKTYDNSKYQKFIHNFFSNMFKKISCLSCIKGSNFDLKINGEKKFTMNNIYFLLL